MQGGRVFARRRGLQPAQGRRRGQRIDSAYRSLQGQVAPQHVVVAHILPTTAQAEDALRQHVAHAVCNTGSTATVIKYSRNCLGQADALGDLPKQQYATVTNDVAAINAASIARRPTFTNCKR